MRDFIDGLLNLSKTIVIGIVVIICVILVMFGLVTGLALGA